MTTKLMVSGLDPVIRYVRGRVGGRGTGEESKRLWQVDPTLASSLHEVMIKRVESRHVVCPHVNGLVLSGSGSPIDFCYQTHAVYCCYCCC
jgi:hypothetical protein